MSENRSGADGVRLEPVGVVRSELIDRRGAPRQGDEGAPDAWIDVEPWAADALRGLDAGDTIVVITWLHQARRDVFRVHPRGDGRNPLTGVFATRSPDRPNPLGLHRVTVRAVEGTRLRVGADRGDRRDAGGRHQDRVELSQKRLPAARVVVLR